MGRRLRMYEEQGLYFVTARTIQGRFLIRQDAKANEVSGGVLARATRLSGVALHAYVFTANHIHLLVSVHGNGLSGFMRHLLGNLSKKLGPLVGWKGHFWDRRFAAEPVFGAEAEIGRLRYLLSHGVKEGLVRSPAQWPGLHCVAQLLSQTVARFPFFEWTRRWKSGRLVDGGARRYEREWATDEPLELAPLPSWRHLSPDARRHRVEQLVSSIEEEGRRTHRSVPGPVALLRKPPHRGPRRLEKTPEPWCHTDSAERWQAYRAAYREFARWFRDASRRFLGGDLLAVFPPRCFRPLSASSSG